MQETVLEKDEEIEKCFEKTLQESDEPLTLDMLRENCHSSGPPPLAQSIRCVLALLRSGRAKQRIVNNPLSFAHVAYVKPN